MMGPLKNTIKIVFEPITFAVDNAKKRSRIFEKKVTNFFPWVKVSA